MLGLFSRKKKNEEIIHLQSISSDIDSYKCLYLAAEKALDIENSWDALPEQSKSTTLSYFGKFPVLHEGEKSFSGAAAILPYLDVRGSGQSLTPKKAARLGEQNYWIQVGQEQVLPRLISLLDASVKNEQREKVLAELGEVMEVANGYLEKRNYFAGSFSFVEIHWMLYIHFCSLLDHAGLVAPYRHLERWFTQIKSRKNARQIVTSEVFPTLEQLQQSHKRYAA